MYFNSSALLICRSTMFLHALFHKKKWKWSCHCHHHQQKVYKEENAISSVYILYLNLQQKKLPLPQHRRCDGGDTTPLHCLLHYCHQPFNSKQGIIYFFLFLFCCHEKYCDLLNEMAPYGTHGKWKWQTRERMCVWNGVFSFLKVLLLFCILHACSLCSSNLYIF